MHHREFKTEVIGFFADIGVIYGKERWTFAKHRFVHLESTEPTKIMELLTYYLRTYGPFQMNVSMYA